MGIEKIFLPVRAVFAICGFCVEAHDGGQTLGDEEDDEAQAESRARLVGGRSLRQIRSGQRLRHSPDERAGMWRRRTLA